MENKKTTEIVEVSENTQLDAFGNFENMKEAWKMAEALAKSTIVPEEYRGNPANCLIAIDMASRLNMSPMMVMQGLYVVKGKPSWSGQMAIALINGSRRYEAPIKFVFEGKGPTLSCYAVATDLEGNIVKGTTITMDMVMGEGWDSDKGSSKSKWKTMPEQMMQYRAASFFARANCPDVLYGIYTADETIEMESPKKTKSEAVNPFAPKEEAEAVETITVVETEEDLPDFMKGGK